MRGLSSLRSAGLFASNRCSWSSVVMVGSARPDGVLGGSLVVVGEVGGEQGVEQRAVMHEGSAARLRAHLLTVSGMEDRVRGAVVLHHGRMIDGDVGGASVEVLDRIAALPHPLDPQPVRLTQGIIGIVDEVGLHAAPAQSE